MSGRGPSTPMAMLCAGLGTAVLVGFIVAMPPSAPTISHAPKPTPGQERVAAHGFTLTSASIDLPDDDQKYPGGAEADVMNRSCTACHSAAMAQVQPPLTAEQWKGEVEKMRDTFKATIDPKDEPAIVAYLSRMSGQAGGGGGLKPAASSASDAGKSDG